MSIRCLIVDDNPGFERIARELLEQDGLDFVGSASNAEEAIRLARDLHPDVALVDIDLGRESGLRVARLLRGEHDDEVPGMVREQGDDELAKAVILISTHAEAEFAELIEASPAVGFIPKSRLSAEAIEALLPGPQSDLGKRPGCRL
jgi:DNA-binding NarL/FixJ family response regulator